MVDGMVERLCCGGEKGNGKGNEGSVVWNGEGLINCRKNDEEKYYG